MKRWAEGAMERCAEVHRGVQRGTQRCMEGCVEMHGCAFPAP